MSLRRRDHPLRAANKSPDAVVINMDDSHMDDDRHMDDDSRNNRRSTRADAFCG